ncbi:hypothetical protein SEA_WHEELBITE_76 [Arthrobacter phage Wheelbite]|uniref:Uncharacterized protein n=1 Tax=Arthrobacter phage Wheelbite TaxID=2015873 RepID=A0A222ZHF2_9CAUD|nr:hypothetical protein KMD23_gp76 [Arthrobacter phage Wheelbite]ASR84164.1 hypothetical protein SEA_WHEELBITE_76 [Arthrobacter phage Wheelbite]
MTGVNITIIRATPREIEVRLTRDPGLKFTRTGARRIMLQMAAFQMGMDVKAFWTSGYDRDYQSGWTVAESGVVDGVEVIYYRVRPMLPAEIQQRLHDHGGMAYNEDGTERGYYLPGQVPAPRQH